MDPFTSFFSTSFLFYAFAIFAVTFVIRTIVEYAVPTAKTSNAWNHLLLPLLPMVLGGISAIFAKMYPDPLGTSIFARETFGLTAGLLSGLVYKMLKGYIKATYPILQVTTTTGTPSVTNTTTTTTPTSTVNVVTTTPSTVTNTVEKMSGGMGQDVYPKP